MKTTKLIIKCQNKYICDNVHNEISFIWIPPYSLDSYFDNVDIFIALLCSGNMSNTYEAIRGLNYVDGLETFEDYFFEDGLSKLDDDIYFYNLDEVLTYTEEDIKKKISKNLKNLPGTLVSYSLEELITESKKESIEKEELFNQDEEVPFFYGYCIQKVDKSLLKLLEAHEDKRQDNDVLLLYSGGKDSTLTAIRLKNAGYNVHFIHFDNGHMMDADKPYLTFKKTFSKEEGYTFQYQNRAVKIGSIFKEYFYSWKKEHGNNLDGYNLDSEIRCLSCRMAMYTSAIIYAKEHGFKYIAEGARISQKFMLEQPAIIERLKTLASKYGIELLFPVLELVDDEEEKQELIANGFSSKGWESKCLLGRPAMEKDSSSEAIILSYYDNHLVENVQKEIHHEEESKKLLKKYLDKTKSKQNNI